MMMKSITIRHLEYTELRAPKIPEETGENFLVKLINRRLDRRNMDCRIIIIGEGGIGKSYIALKIGEHIQPELFIDEPEKAVEENIHFEAKEFMRAVTTLKHKSLLIFDEVGQEWHHREFMSQANVLLSKTMIGFRFKRFVSVLCIPVISLLDKDARKLAQYKIDVLDHGYAEVQRIQPSRWTDDVWYPPIGDLRVSLPNQGLRKAYEEKKRICQDRAYEGYFRKLEKTVKKEVTNDEIISAISKNPDSYWDEKKNRLSVIELTGAFDIGRDRATRLRARYERLERLKEEGE